MKIKSTKVISFIMSAVMTVSALSLPNLNAFAETNDTQTKTSNIQDSEIQYGGMLGSMLSDEISQSVESNQEAESLDYTVYKIYHDPNTAYVGVDYKAKNDCTLFVGFYNDEGTELLSSVTKELQATDIGFAEMNILDILPDHYLVKAFIIGKELLNPLSKPCYYNKYTKQMQEILATTTDDFSEDKEQIINLDDNNKNNFIVLKDGVIDITPSEDTDVYKGKDENDNYIFENAVQISNLKKGDKVFVRSTPDMIAFVVDNIETNGNTVVISHSGEKLEDFIKFIKIDSNEYNGESYTENSNNEDNKIARQQYPQPFNPPTDNDDPFALQFPTIQSEFDFAIDINREETVKEVYELSAKENGNVKGYGSLTLIANSKVEIYFEPHIFEDNYLSVDVQINTEAIVSIGLSVSKTFPIGPSIGIPVFSVGIVTITFKPSLSVSATGKIDVDFTKSYFISYDSFTGLSCSSPDPTIIKLSGEARIEISLNASIELVALAFKVIEVKLGVGFRIKIHDDGAVLYSKTGTVIKTPYYTITPKNPERYIHHDCKNCISFDVSFFVQLSIIFSVEVFGIEGLGFSKTFVIPLYEKPLPSLSFHVNDDGFNWGKCTNYSQNISMTVKSKKSGEPINGVKFYISSDNQKEKLITSDYDGSEVVTYGKGQTDFYVKEALLKDPTCKIKAVASTGEYEYCNVGVFFDEEVTGQYDFIVEINLKNEKASSNNDKDKENSSTSGSTNEGTFIDSKHGVCGYAEDKITPTVFYDIYPNNEYENVCYIYGGGEINSADNIPSDVDKIVIADTNTKLGDYAFSSKKCSYNVKSIDISTANITEIPTWAFSDCRSLKEIKLPQNLEKICDHAFQNCISLISINLPDTVKYINTGAFYNCISLTSFTAPSNLKEIGYQAFWECNNLKEVELNEGLEYIASEAFLLTNIQSINIPSTVTKIGYHEVFADGHTNKPRALRTIIFNSDFDVVSEKGSNPSNVEKDYNIIEDSTNTTWGNAYSIFSDCVKLTNVVFNEGVTKINDGLLKDKPVAQVKLPSTLKKIGIYAFYGTKITSISLPNGLEAIGDYAFLNTGVHSITINYSDCTIGKQIIPSGPQYTIYGHDGSTAQAFAESNNNTFISLDTKPAQITTTTVTTTTTTTTTTVTATVSTVIGPQKECVFIAVNDPSSVNSPTEKLLDVDNVKYFDQQTANENGTVIFSFVPDIVSLTHIFISEITDSLVTQTVAVPGEEVKTTQYKVTEPVTTLDVTLYGDTNNDGSIDMSDAVGILQALANPNKYGISGTAEHHITEQGIANADVYDPGTGITSMDALAIQWYLVKKIDSLPFYP